MRKILFGCVLLLSSAAYAESREISISAVEFPSDEASDLMVKTSTGEVFWVAANDSALVEKLKGRSAYERVFKAEVGLNGFLSDLKVTSKKALYSEFDNLGSENKESFYPTVHTSEAYMRDAFNSLDNRTHEDSQCYNRAHPWAYDLWRTRGINSMKIFLFFTDKYIREFRHKWWFHVAPMTYLATPQGAVEYVLDRSYSERPLFTRVWTNTFIKNEAECRSVNNYFDYFKDSPTEYCYLIRSTMYYRGTVALRRRDEGVSRNRWSLREMREARQQAFIYANDYNP
jgi:hypothetical protein